MRVLFLSRSDGFDGGSSMTNVPLALFRRMLAYAPDTRITWALPRGVPEEVLVEGVLAQLGDVADRVTMVPVLARSFGRMMGYYLTEEVAELFRQTKTQEPYDVVLNQHPAMTPVYRTILANRYRASRFNVDVPIVNLHLWTATLDQLERVPEYYVGEPDIAAECLGAFFAHENVWESEYLLRSALRTLRTWLKPSAVRAVQENSQAVHIGIEYDRILAATADRRAERIAAGDGPCLFWGGRFANQKKTKDTLPLMRQVALRHPRSPVVVTTPHAEVPEWATAGYPDWRIEAKVTNEMWHDRLGLGDVFLCNSVSESYGLAWIEMLAAGMLGVFERMWWQDGLLPDWYPFIAETRAEQVDMASVLMDQWPDGPLWREYGPKVQEWIRTEQDAGLSGPRLHRILEKAHGDALVRMAPYGRGSIGQLAHRAAEKLWAEGGGEPIEAERIYAEMTKVSDADREWGKRSDIVSPMYLRACLQVNGWVDVGRGATPVMVRS